MGWIVHHATIVTTFNRAGIDRAHQEAVRLFGGFVTAPIKSAVNGYWSFLIPPDGSKEGWSASEAGNQARARFRAWITQQAYEDRSNAYAAVEVAYGEIDHPILTALDGEQTAIAGDDGPDLLRLGRIDG